MKCSKQDCSHADTHRYLELISRNTSLQLSMTSHEECYWLQWWYGSLSSTIINNHCHHTRHNGVHELCDIRMGILSHRRCLGNEWDRSMMVGSVTQNGSNDDALDITEERPPNLYWHRSEDTEHKQTDVIKEQMARWTTDVSKILDKRRHQLGEEWDTATIDVWSQLGRQRIQMQLQQVDPGLMMAFSRGLWKTTTPTGLMMACSRGLWKSTTSTHQTTSTWKLV